LDSWSPARGDLEVELACQSQGLRQTRSWGEVSPGGDLHLLLLDTGLAGELLLLLLGTGLVGEHLLLLLGTGLEVEPLHHLHQGIDPGEDSHHLLQDTDPVVGKLHQLPASLHQYLTTDRHQLQASLQLQRRASLLLAVFRDTKSWILLV